MIRSRASSSIRLLVVVSVLLPFMALADSRPCTEAIDRKAYDEAFDVCLAFAEQGDANAMHNLAYLYVTVKKDELEGYAWYHRAASFGDPNSGKLLDIIRTRNNERIEMLVLAARGLAASHTMLQDTVRRMQSSFEATSEQLRERHQTAEESLAISLQMVDEVVQQTGMVHLNVVNRR